MSLTVRTACTAGLLVATHLLMSGCSRAGDTRTAGHARAGTLIAPRLDPSSPPSGLSHAAATKSAALAATASGATASAGTSSDVRVMSFNLRVRTVFDHMNHWDLRKGLLLATIREFDPDILGTQEGLAGQADYLRKRLADYRFVGAGRNDGKRGGEMCGVFYKASRFTRLDHGHFWLSETPRKPGSKSWGSVFPRMVTWVKLRPTDGGEAIVCFNTHFDAFASTARLQSAKMLRKQIETIAGGLPVIVTGDFNADAGTDPYDVLLTGNARASGPGPRLVDTFLAANPGAENREDGTRHAFRGGRGGPRIDWIVTSGAFQTVSAAIHHNKAPFRYPSDHFPVTAVLRMGDTLPVARIE